MFGATLSVIWGFFKTNIGKYVFGALAVLAFVYSIYYAGQRSEQESAQKAVKATQDKAKKDVAAIQGKYDALLSEQKAWKAELAKAVQKAKEGQKRIIDDLHDQLAKAEEKKAIVKTVIKEIPKYVTVKADSVCTVNDGFVWLYDYSLQNTAVSGGENGNGSEKAVTETPQR